AIIYGKDVVPVPLTISDRQWRLVQHHVKSNTLIKIEMEEGGRTEEKPVMLKKTQRSITGKVLHVDFLQVSMERSVQVEVPIHLIGGEPIGVTKGGVIEQHLRTIMVESLPGQIPGAIEVDISKLDIGDSIHVHEISLPGTKLLEHPDVAIVGVTPPEKEEVTAPAGETAEKAG
ncbi:MAG TPA: 50S ribosomal protein L25, partial [Deltaproteobacteria bacterium]|nr:50S ribosomal protein L25 [Deltaproteobacteria bacterium]